MEYRGNDNSKTLKAKKQSASKNADPKDLDKPQSREEFKKIQAQMMAQYKGRPGYDEAIAMQNSMYEALASGQMSVEELQAKAKSVSGEAKGYSANETAEYPELQSLLKVLDNFSNANIDGLGRAHPVSRRRMGFVWRIVERLYARGAGAVRCAPVR